jgi:peptidoglycan/xylan/chitin deacetylase (PgdA/CDA1 family)
MAGVWTRSTARRALARGVVVAAVAVLSAMALLAAGGCTSTGRGPATLRIYVVRHGQVRAAEVTEGVTVAEVLRRAGVSPHDGQVRSVVRHRALGPNDRPARLRVGARAVSRTTVVRTPITIAVTDGTDTTEPTRVVVRSLPATGLPDAIQYVQAAGRPGRGESVVGARSGEVVSTRVARPPVPPHRSTGKVIALTFDDGPSPTWTPLVLAILKAKGVPATFCEVGDLVRKHPELTRAVADAGHELCNHTDHHVEGLETQPRPTIDAEIGGGSDAIEQAAGVAPTFYRPPGGSLAPVIYEAAADHHEHVLYWSVDPRDWKRPTTHDLVVDIVNAFRPGGIVLLHDGGGDRSQTVAALAGIIDYGRALGYTFVVPVSGRPQVG